MKVHDPIKNEVGVLKVIYCIVGVSLMTDHPTTILFFSITAGIYEVPLREGICIHLQISWNVSTFQDNLEIILDTVY